jgi:hypothetical protein
MKRIFLVGTMVSLVFLSLSCTSTEAAVQEEAPQDVSIAFERVYNTYRSTLILDGAETYTVVSGDFLAAIARRFYGSGNGYFFPLIMLASSDVVLDPELIEPGMELAVPDLQRNLDDPVARESIEAFLRDIAGVYEQKIAAFTEEERATRRGNTRYTEDIRTRERLIALADSL